MERYLKTLKKKYSFQMLASAHLSKFFFALQPANIPQMKIRMINAHSRSA